VGRKATALLVEDPDIVAGVDGAKVSNQQNINPDASGNQLISDS
jgi:hypothetical protein